MTGVAMSLWTSRPIDTPAEPQLRQLLGLRDAEPVVAARAAVLLGVVRAEDAELTRALEDLVREELGLLPLVGVGSELLLGELRGRSCGTGRAPRDTGWACDTSYTKYRELQDPPRGDAIAT